MRLIRPTFVRRGDCDCDRRRGLALLAAIAAVALPLWGLPHPARAAAAAAALQDDSLQRGLIAYWQGNGTAEDASGNGHGGLATPGVRYVAAFQGRRGFYFDGRSAAGIRVPDAPIFALTSSLTLAAWVKADSSIWESQIVFRGDNRPGLDPWFLNVTDAHDGTAQVGFTVESADPEQSVTVHARIPLGRFIAIAGTLDGDSGKMRLYIDGHVAAEEQTDVRPFGNLEADQTPGVGIGNTQDPNAINETFVGTIQDVRVYNRALTDYEVARLAAMTHEETPQPAGAALYRYWERFPRPKRLIIAPKPATQQEAAVLQTLAGLVARAERAGKSDRLIWIDNGHPAYAEWRRRMLAQTHAVADGPFGTWQLVDRFAAAGLVRGYIVYHYDDSPRAVHEDGPTDTSLNVATSLCGRLGAIAVADKDEATAVKHGLKRLFDARTLSEADCFAKYRSTFSRRRLALIDPKVADMRAEAVAEDAFVVSRTGPLYEQALDWMSPDFPVIGWSIGDERGITLPSTRAAGFQTDSDWCQNLPPLSTEQIGETIQARRPASATIWDVPWDDDAHYATFIMSDGDNLQWLMGDFLMGSEKSWWSSPARGTLPMGWTCCFDGLAQVCPYAGQYLFKTATPRDDFILFGGGYYYPDHFGKSRNDADDPLALHLTRIGEYARRGGFHLMMFNFQDNGSQEALDADGTIVRRVPGLFGAFTINYDSYTSGGGSVRWIPGGDNGETPVVAMRFGIWNHSINSGQGDPRKVAGFLNGMPHGEPIDTDHFSAVVVHCWSWFRPPQDGDEEVDQGQGGSSDTARGVLPAKWCASQLQPYVHVVTPTQFIQLMRLRIHPEPTLTLELRRLSTELRRRAAAHPNDPRLVDAQQEIRAALQSLADGHYREAWQTGRIAYGALSAGS